MVYYTTKEIAYTVEAFLEPGIIGLSLAHSFTGPYRLYE